MTEEELAVDESDIDARTRAALSFAQQLTIDHHGVGKEHFDELKCHFTHAEIVELGLFCAIQIGSVRFVHAANLHLADLEAVEQEVKK